MEVTAMGINVSEIPIKEQVYHFTLSDSLEMHCANYEFV